jgi:hypothetical protein
MEMNAYLPMKFTLSAVIIRADGSREDCGVLSKRTALDTIREAPRSWLRRFWKILHREAAIPVTMGFGAFVASLWGADGALMAIVTTAGVNYMATDFASGGVTPTISGFKFHDSGTGVAAAVVGDTALGTPAGPARVTGTPSNPTANQYRSVATIAYTGTLAITEWGLFSASTTGTLWDRRVFSALNVVNGDSIQFTYTLTVPNGGS